MANNNPESEAVNGHADTPPAVERTSEGGEQAATPQATTSLSAVPPALKKQHSNTSMQRSPSAGNSPRTSRNTSPIRKDSKPTPLSTPSTTQPSAAAIQRALSAANVPQLQAGGATDGVSKLAKPATKSAGGSGETTPRWPTSPRLKSPPPSGSNSRKGSANTQKKVEGTPAPSINVQSATPQSSTPPPAKQGSDETSKQPQQLQTPVKGPSRGPSGKSTLETVQENSADDTREPSPAAIKAAADLKPLTKLSDDENQSSKRDVNAENEKHTQNGESGSESASTKSDKKKDQDQDHIAQRPKNAHTKSYNPLSTTKSRQESKQGMTVETETVQSIPQSAINAGERSNNRNDGSGSVRLKPSNETIRPKKERKKATPKTRSLNQGIASSKADIFEARVASAVDEANSSSSDETFVYESNPPEPQRRTGRHHSRTPSVTSSHSVADGQRSGAMRNFGDTLDERRVAGKRSMKFSNNANFNDADGAEGGKDGSGSVRSHHHTPRHFGRFGRGASQNQGGNVFDADSPFTQASKLRTNQLGSRNSRPNSPRSPHGTPQTQRGPSSLFGRKGTTESSYDFDAEGGDETERTPLIGTVRTPRSSGRLPRRINSHSANSIDEYYGVRRHSRCGRFGGCFLFLVVLVAVIISTVAFLFMSNRPLYDVRVCGIQNVLTSEQELMFDLVVGAVNPNALNIKVDEMNVDVFAKSRHVGKPDSSLQLLSSPGSAGSTFRHPRQRLPWTQGGHDHGTDPPPDDDLEKDAQTMLLGRLLHFDSGLSFDGSPLKRHLHTSVGTVRLEKPGNKTETGGSARWERVLQFEFELIAKGVLKYSLPVSSRVESAAISGHVQVVPDDENDGDDGGGEMWKWRVDEDLCAVDEDEEHEVEGRGRLWWPFG